MKTSGTAQGPSLDRPVAVAALCVLTVFAYWRAIGAYFFDDDFQWLVGSWAFHPSQLVDIPHLSHFYRPVIDLYFAAATPLFGGSPVLFHLANLTLHIANVLLLMTLAHAVSGRALYGFLTALFFAVQPGDIDAIAWVSALAEPVSAFFGLIALIGFVRFRRTGAAGWRALSAVTFLAALLTHESSVMFLPLMALADWAFCTQTTDLKSAATAGRLRAYIPYVVLAAAYLAIDLQINSRNYVVTQGYYRLGSHIVGNALDYLTALYVGRGDLSNYLLVSVGVVVLLVKGSRRVVFATSWMLLALLPFLFFRWSNTSRYLYLPAMGFSMLVAEGVLQIERLMASRASRMAATAVMAIIATAIAGRFTIFAVRNVKAFAERAETYRRYVTLFKEIHGPLASNTAVPPDPRLRVKHEPAFLAAAVQWEYRDPTITLQPEPPDAR